MPKTVPIKVRDISTALWGLEDWVRALREVLSYMDPNTSVQVPEDLVKYSMDGGGTIKLIRGCPPPAPEDEECDDEHPGRGHAYGHDKEHGKGKGKGKAKAKGAKK